MVEHIGQILIAKEQYFQGMINEHHLKEVLLKIRKNYETCSNTHFFPNNLSHKLALFLIAEKFKYALLFEKNLVSIFDSECTKLQRKMDNIIDMMNVMNERDLYRYESYIRNNSSTNGWLGSSPHSRRANFPREVSKMLRRWLKEHLSNPYPTKIEKKILSKETGLKLSQIDNWFANARKRILPFMRKEFIDLE
ncbi:hypothetical protein P7C65_06s1g09050 [Encephalitozoon intestinalis]